MIQLRPSVPALDDILEGGGGSLGLEVGPHELDELRDPASPSGDELGLESDAFILKSDEPQSLALRERQGRADFIGAL